MNPIVSLLTLLSLGPVMLVFMFVLLGIYMTLRVIIKTIKLIYRAVEDYKLTKSLDDDDDW